MGSAPSLTCQTKEASDVPPDMDRTDRPKVATLQRRLFVRVYLVKLGGHIGEFGHQEIGFSRASHPNHSYLLLRGPFQKSLFSVRAYYPSKPCQSDLRPSENLAERDRE